MVDSPQPLLAFPRKPERQHLFLSVLVLLGISYMLFMRAQFPGAQHACCRGAGCWPHNLAMTCPLTQRLVTSHLLTGKPKRRACPKAGA